MRSATALFSFRDVVLVADRLNQTNSATLSYTRRDLEMTDACTLTSLQDAIHSLGLATHLYSGPDALADNAMLHRNDIVLSIYGGETSRNRMALVPAVCETFGLRFIGPDVYGRIVAQDKEISKRLAADCGLTTPAWRVIRNTSDLKQIAALRLPVVVKPLLEGSSIGISQRNRAACVMDAMQLAEEMLAMFAQPVLVEEFVAGREVAYCRIQHTTPDAWAFSEVTMKNDPDFFIQRLFDADEKMTPSAGRSVRNIDQELHEQDRVFIERFLSAVSPYGYCRVDGRLAGGRFHFLELTPDAWIAPRGQFARGFTEKGWTYPAVIAAVLCSAV